MKQVDRAIVSQELPPLPERAGWVIDMGWEDGWAVSDRHGVLSDGCDVYTADQMQAYARTAVEAARLKEREECAALCDDLHHLPRVGINASNQCRTYDNADTDSYDATAERIAAAIRSRK